MEETKKAPLRGQPRVVVGLVTSDKMTKTVVVRVERYFRHPKYGKYIRRFTTCTVHDEKEEAQIGDRVEIMATRPISKTKHWRLVRIVERSKNREEATPASAAPAKS